MKKQLGKKRIKKDMGFLWCQHLARLRLFQLAFGGVITFFIYIGFLLSHQERTFGHQLREDHVTGRRLRQVPSNQTQECSVKWPVKSQLLHYRWHVHRAQQPPNPVISVFSAFLDQRSWTVPSSSIRIFGVATVNESKTVYCQIWEDASKQPLITKAILRNVGRGYSKDKVKYMEYLFTCLTPSAMNPKFVSLTFDFCENSTIRLPVIEPEKHVEPPVKFGICVAVTYGHISPTRLVEWIELNKLLGVGEINVYNSSISRTTMDVLNSYIQDGVIVIRSAPPPIPDWDYWPKKLAVIAALNDCLYRNMFRYDYLIVTDLDEFIIPKPFLTYQEIFSNINTMHGVAINPVSYIFRNEYFFLDLGPVNNRTQFLITRSYTKRMPISRRGYAVKSTPDPSCCVVLSNHNCISNTTDAGKRWTLEVNETVATNQHYKKCHFSSHKCNEMLLMFVTDNTILKYGNNLLQNFKKKSDDLLYDLDLDIHLSDHS